MKLRPLAIISLKRMKELEDAEQRLRHVSRIIMMVEHVKTGEKTTRQILYRSSLGDLPDQLTVAGNRHSPNVMRLFGLDTLYLGQSGEGYDIVFMEP